MRPTPLSPRALTRKKYKKGGACLNCAAVSRTHFCFASQRAATVYACAVQWLLCSLHRGRVTLTPLCSYFYFLRCLGLGGTERNMCFSGCCSGCSGGCSYRYGVELSTFLPSYLPPSLATSPMQRRNGKVILLPLPSQVSNYFPSAGRYILSR